MVSERSAPERHFQWKGAACARIRMQQRALEGGAHALASRARGKCAAGIAEAAVQPGAARHRAQGAVVERPRRAVARFVHDHASGAVVRGWLKWAAGCLPPRVLGGAAADFTIIAPLRRRWPFVRLQNPCDETKGVNAARPTRPCCAGPAPKSARPSIERSRGAATFLAGARVPRVRAARRAIHQRFFFPFSAGVLRRHIIAQCTIVHQHLRLTHTFGVARKSTKALLFAAS